MAPKIIANVVLKSEDIHFAPDSLFTPSIFAVFLCILIFAPILISSGTLINLLLNIVSSISLFPQDLVSTARMAGMLSVANEPYGPVFIFAGSVGLLLWCLVTT